MRTLCVKRPSYPQHRNTAFEVNLNEAPSCENLALESTSTCVFQNAQSSRQGWHTPPVTVNLEEVEEELVITSSKVFEAARRYSSRRNYDRNLNRMVTMVLDDNQNLHQGCLEEPTKRTLSPAFIRGCNAIINLGKKRKEVTTILDSHPKPLAAVLQERIFTCVICMGPLVEEHSTLCGHIFCKECIMTAFESQKKCPVCRRKLRLKNIHRVYLPAFM